MKTNMYNPLYGQWVDLTISVSGFARGVDLASSSEKRIVGWLLSDQIESMCLYYKEKS